MGVKTKIEWTRSEDGSAGATWNPVTGCTKISPGCKHCYAERMAKRLQAMGQKNYASGFELTLQDHAVELPLRWKKPQTVFVNSMSDLFHEDVPVDFIKRVFDVMKRAHWHRFQILTKRSKRLAKIGGELEWAPNVWMGVSIELDKYCTRASDLRRTGAHVKFLSLEPLLGPLPSLDLSGINWVIIGGESGPGARPCEIGWIRSVIEQCKAAGVPCFVKQLGAVPLIPQVPEGLHGPDVLAAARGIDLEWPADTHFGNQTGDPRWNGRQALLHDSKGGDPSEWPEDLRVREFQKA